MGRSQLTGPVTEYIAGEIRAARARKRLTFEQLADMSGVSLTTLKRAEKGESAIAVEILFPIFTALDIDFKELLNEIQRLSK